MANIIDFGTFRRGNVIETTSPIIKEEPIMTPIQTVGTIGRQSTFAHLGKSIKNSETVEEAKAKVKQIEEYIRTEIIPHTNDSIYLSVGNELEKNSGRHHFHLWIDSRGVSDTILGSAGHLDIYFKKEDMPSTAGGSVYIYDSWNYGGEFCYELIKDWNNIKRKLLDFRGKVERQEAETRKVFDDFKL